MTTDATATTMSGASAPAATAVPTAGPTAGVPLAGPQPASEASIQAVVAALTAGNIEAVVVDTAADARALVLARVPAGAEVHWGKSKTLDDLGLVRTFLDTERYAPLRPTYTRMDRATQGREIRKLIAAPDFMLGSVQAVTEDGTLVAASYTGFQLGAYAVSAGQVILVVGSQKIVPDLDAAMRRVREVVQPYEDAMIRASGGAGSELAKLLLTFAESRPGRTTVIIVREPVGI